MENRPPLPPFTLESAQRKARAAEDAWNSRDPVRVSLAYTADSRWRNRAEFIEGRDANTLNTIATRGGMLSLYEDGLRKVAAGLTTLDEVVRVTQDQSDA